MAEFYWKRNDACVVDRVNNDNEFGIFRESYYVSYLAGRTQCVWKQYFINHKLK